MSFKDHLVAIATARGLPPDVSPEDLLKHAREHLTQTIGTPPTVQLQPASKPDADTESVIIEARQPFSQQDLSLASVTEDGLDRFKDHRRRELVTEMVRRLMQEGWIDVRIEDNEVIAVLRVVRPNA